MTASTSLSLLSTSEDTRDQLSSSTTNIGGTLQKTSVPSCCDSSCGRWADILIFSLQPQDVLEGILYATRVCFRDLWNGVESIILCSYEIYTRVTIQQYVQRTSSYFFLVLLLVSNCYFFFNRNSRCYRRYLVYHQISFFRVHSTEEDYLFGVPAEAKNEELVVFCMYYVFIFGFLLFFFGSGYFRSKSISFK